MPVYTYHCENCGHEFDRQQSFTENALKICPSCKKHTLQKVYRPAGIVFKGSGYYVTDARKSPAGSAAKKPKANGAGESKGESKTETKSESKSETSSTKKKDD
jgi:putative FmdB family regulatory protein